MNSDLNPSDAAMRYLLSIGVDNPDLAVGMVTEFEWGWSVHINSAKYWANRDPMKMLVGLSPVFVSRQFICKIYPTGMSYEEMRANFASECAA